MRVAQARWSVEDVAESYALWWREAGLHSATSPQPHGWLAPEPVAPRVAEPRRELGEPPMERLAEPAAAAALPPPATRNAPGNLADFRTWLEQDASQPETGWDGPLCLPPAQGDARLLVLFDMPDDGFADPAMPFDAATARFIGAMLATIGLSPDQAAFAPLAMRRPPSGLMNDEVFAALAGRMRSYLALARPQAALILGDRTSRALLAAQGNRPGGNLPEIYLEGGTIPACALATPDMLMRRPMAKAASWQALRLLHGVLNG